jgi:hypothetical protein
MTAAVEALAGTLKGIEEALRARTPDNADEVLDYVAESLAQIWKDGPGARTAEGPLMMAPERFKVEQLTGFGEGWSEPPWAVWDLDSGGIRVFTTEAQARANAKMSFPRLGGHRT